MSRGDSVRRRDVRMAVGVLVLAAVAVLAPHVRVGSGQPAPPERAGRVVRHDPRFDRLVPPGSTLEKVAGGLTWAEGPVWDAARGTLLVSDVSKNSVFEWRDGPGLRLFMNPSGYTGTAPFAGREPGSNGLAFDADKRLVLCEQGDRRIARLEVDGHKTTLADRYEGKRLNSPNDLAFAGNGDLYFTDPPVGLPKGFDDPGKELGWSGVYRLTPEGRLTLLTRELKAPNGIALSPSSRTLYVSNAERSHAVWMAYDLAPDGTLGGGRVFFDATPWTRTKKGAPDGMKVDAEGNLFATGPGGVHVFAPDGTHLGSLELDVPTSNVAWGGDGSTLYVTASSAVYRIGLTTRGLGF
jgi:gluconolactonase